MLPSDSAEPGRYKTSRTPYFLEVQKAFTEPNVKKIVVKSSSQVGKALDVATPIPTPDGFKLMGDLAVGDKVFDERGEVCNVIATSPIMHNRPCYEVTFSDGAKLVADAEHNWFVLDAPHGTGRKVMRLLTTAEIAATFKHGNRNRYAIPVAEPLKLPERDLPIDPYLFGYWIGNGMSKGARLTSFMEDVAVIDKIRAADYEVRTWNVKDAKAFYTYVGKNTKQNRTLHEQLRRLGVLNNKHIPEIYLRASYEQRLELLRGLMDSDGNIDTEGYCEFYQKSRETAEAVFELLGTLGIKPTLRHKMNDTGGCWRVAFTAYDDVPVFHLERKFSRQRAKSFGNPLRVTRRRITNVEKVESHPVKCISVDSPNHLYLAGREFVPTHNSEVLLNVVGRMAQLDPCSILIVQPTLEMAQDFSRSRLSKMIADTKSLTPLFYDKVKTRDTNQTILSKFFTGGRVVLAGANSPAGLASRPIRILLCDEVDRFPADCGGEGDPVGLAEKRTSNFWDAKVALFSTPTTLGASRIDIEYNLGTREVWKYQCPNCREFHALTYQQMQTDFQTFSDEAGNKSVIVKSVVWQCPDCGFEFTEREIKNAPQRYEAQNPDALANGVRSFSLNAFSSPWLSWADIMREWLEAKGNPSREAVVMNTRFGESYEFTGTHEDENEFLKRRVEYEAELPEGVLLLTAAVDVQADRLEYEIAGWSAGFTRYGIQRGIVRGKPSFPVTWAALDKVLDRVFFFADGTGMTVARVFIDSGFSTANVYEYCRRNFSKGRFPIKGRGGAGLPLIHKYTRVEGAGVMLVILGVDDGKSEVMNRLSIADADGRMIFPKDDEFLGQRGYNEKYFKQLLAERRVVRKSGGVIHVTWENVKRARNESLDLAVYTYAAAVSCAGNNPAEFWRSRHALIRGEPVTKPKRKSVKKFVEGDIYDET